MDWKSKGVRFAPVRLVPRARAETVTREQQSPAALGGGLVQASQALGAPLDGAISSRRDMT